MKVLYLIETLGVGGAEQSLLQIIPRLQDVEPVMCHIYEGHDLRPAFEAAGVPVVSLCIPPKYNFPKAIRAVRDLVQAEQPDLIHTTLFRADVVGRIVGRHERVPVLNSFVSECYAEIRWRSLTRLGRAKLTAVHLIDRWTAPLASHFVANSETVRQSESRSLGIPLDRVTVVHRGRDPSRFAGRASAEDRRRLLSALGVAPDSVVILNVGRLVDSKGHAELIDAFLQIEGEVSDAVLLLAGEGPELGNIEARVAAVGLERKILLLGLRSDVPRLLSIADIFAFPSHYEGHPGALVEAMFASCPIVASDTPVHRETLADGECGLLVPVGQAAPLARGIRQLIQDRAAAEQLSIRGRSRAESWFQVERTAERYELLYRRIASDYRAGQRYTVQQSFAAVQKIREARARSEPIVSALQTDRVTIPGNGRSGRSGAKRRILHCSYSGLGGHATDLFTLLRSAARDEFEHSVVFFGVEDLCKEYAQTCDRLGIPYMFIRKEGKIAVRSHREVLDAIDRFEPDIVMINGTPLAIPVLLCRKRGRRKWAVIVRETQANHLKTYQEWLGSYVAARMADAVVYLTPEYRAEVEGRFRLAVNRPGISPVIPNGVEVPSLSGAARGSRDMLHVAMVSRLVPIKDHATLIEAVRILTSERGRTDIHLQIAGEGPTSGSLQAQVVEAGVDPYVDFTGLIDQAGVHELLMSADIYVHCTFGETMSNSILQAMAAGLPVIASDVQGVSNLIRNGDDGILVPVQDPLALADALEHLIHSPQLRQELGRNACKRIEEEFSQERAAEAYTELFRTLSGAASR